MNILKLVFRLLLGQRLPITHGALQIPALNQPVLIRRDNYGIVYIEAKEDHDAWYGLGFCQGQDRAFQIEGLLRVVRGTLAELVGPTALPVDRLSRRIGFRRAGEQQLEASDEQTRQIIAAYTQGVNDGVRVGCHRLPHEFTLLRAQPTRYQPADVLAILALMSFNLASNWDVELARLKILSEDGPEALKALDPTYPEWLPATSPPTAPVGQAVDRLAEDLNIFLTTVSPGGGSNNWAIAPARTATGRAILANDPHLAPSLPPYWYLAHVRTPDWAIAGAAFAGTPAFPAGHNGTAAWGITAGLLDNTDLFRERIGPDGASIWENGQFIPCETRSETIFVKGGESIAENVLITPRGPIISPALEGQVEAISLQATWLARRPVKGLFQLHQARSFEAFRRTFEQWPGLPLNMAYADTRGSIGWQLVGESPRRRQGWGTLPLPGWNAQVGWEETPVPFDEMPHLQDPEIGFVATANNQPTPQGSKPFLGADWLDSYRLARIAEALKARTDWNLHDTLTLQIDQESILWRDLRASILSIPADTAEVRQALAMMKTWNGSIAADSAEAAIFELFVAEMSRRLVESKAPRSARWALGKGFTSLNPQSLFSIRRGGHLASLVQKQAPGWFERSWPAEMGDALATVIRTLRQRYGDDPGQWAWGRIRTLTLRHTVGEQAPLDRIFNLGPFAWGGDAHTIGQASADPLDPTTNPIFIASLRMVIDVGDWDQSRFVLPGGQSGNPLSPHYDDQLALWRQGQGIPIAWSTDKVEAASQSSLHLKPA